MSDLSYQDLIIHTSIASAIRLSSTIAGSRNVASICTIRSVRIEVVYHLGVKFLGSLGLTTANTTTPSTSSTITSSS